jgi:hypothetical protein
MRQTIVRERRKVAPEITGRGMCQGWHCELIVPNGLMLGKPDV